MATVTSSSLPGVVRAIVNAALAAVATCVALRFVLVTARLLSTGEEWLAIAVATVVLGIPSALAYKRLYSWRIWVFCAVFAIVSAGGTVLVGYLAKLTWSSGGVPLTPYPRSLLVPILLDEVIVGVAAVVGTLSAWGLSRVVRGRIEIDDRVLCPSCSYCLVGAENLACPECGRSFTFEQLGVTREDVACYRETQGRMARPITPDATSHRRDEMTE